ncbi:hypothetical protein MPL1032_10229 [Mesorhizobium plurifarium]|uniref:Uncharacterized protein n=1 Tax=Mesorhizobium plurifarium TaxID=69974 RepID=A0A0K2VMQ0_MESPL|nr:hypothetical protein MPL1032_10229 [Mesorhizobium plurifarium]
MMTSPDDIRTILQSGDRAVADAPAKGSPDYYPHRAGVLIAHLDFVFEDIQAAIIALERSRSPEGRSALARLQIRASVIGPIVAEHRAERAALLARLEKRQ